MTCWRSSGGCAAAAYMVIGSRARQARVHDDVHVRLLRHLRALAAGRGVRGLRAGRWAATRRRSGGCCCWSPLTAQLMGHSVFNHLLATTSPVLVSLALLLEVPGASLLAAATPRPGAAVRARSSVCVVILAGHGAGDRRTTGAARRLEQARRSTETEATACARLTCGADRGARSTLRGAVATSADPRREPPRPTMPCRSPRRPLRAPRPPFLPRRPRLEPALPGEGAGPRPPTRCSSTSRTRWRRSPRRTRARTSSRC